MNIKSTCIDPVRLAVKGRFFSFLFFCCFLLSGFTALSSTYYVDAQNGSDDFDGQAAVYLGGNIGPWKTILKVNETSFAPGDSVLFRRSGLWTDGPIDPKNGGEAGGGRGLGERARAY